MTDKLKICMFTLGSFPKGGAGTLIDVLSRSLSKKECEISIICPFIKKDEIEGIENVEINPLSEPNEKKTKIRVLLKIRALLRLCNIIKHNNFDIIHAHYVFPTGTLGVLVKPLGTPIIVTSHGEDIQKDEVVGYGYRLNKVYAIIIWLTLKLIDAHVLLNKTMIKDAIEAGSNPSKIRVVYNGIDLNKIPFLGGTDILQRYKITEDNFTVLYLGRLHAKKCPDDLVKAFPKVVEKVPNAKLVFAGKGEEENKLKRLTSKLNLSDKVMFTGFVSEAEKWDLLKRCDVFILPSAVEAFGIATIEAMACSKPVIATNVGPFPEVIKDGETGLLVPLHSHSDLADAIIELALDDDRRMKMGKMARKDVEERFDINKIADEYLRIYKELINKKKRRMP